MDSLQTRLGYTFKKPELLELAMTHPSVRQGKGKSVLHNQRLEFLGDSVLQLVLTTELYHRYPELGEGPLTKARARLVNSSSLAGLGKSLGLGEHMLLSPGEQMQGGRERGSTLGDTFEAVLGAIYLDAGFAEAARFILKHFEDGLREIAGSGDFGNPKGVLQEMFQEKFNTTPVYRLLATSGPDHHRVFESVVEHEGRELGRGLGSSIKASESEAAAAALLRLKSDQGIS